MMISIPYDGTDLYESIQTPEKYVEFQKLFRDRCSNCIEHHDTVLGSRVALWSQSAFDDQGSAIHLSTVHRTKGFDIGFLYDTYTPERKKIIEDFISSFEFLD